MHLICWPGDQVDSIGQVSRCPVNWKWWRHTIDRWEGHPSHHSKKLQVCNRYVRVNRLGVRQRYMQILNYGMWQYNVNVSFCFVPFLRINWTVLRSVPFRFVFLEQKTKNVHKTISIGTVVNRSVSRGIKNFIGALQKALHKFLVFAWPVTEMYCS